MDKRTVLIIGASSDLGCAFLEHYGKEYDTIFAHYRRMNARLESIIRQAKGRIIPVKADLLNGSEVIEMIKYIESENAWPDSIVHFTAPQCENQRFNKIDWQVFSDEISIGLKSAVMVAQAFFPKMTKDHFGRMVVILSSVTCGETPGFCANYVVSKYALLGLVKALSAEYGPKGITINGISPHWTNTKYISNQPQVLVEKQVAESPMGRLLEEDEIVPTIAYLLSAEASGISGENIEIKYGKQIR